MITKPKKYTEKFVREEVIKILDFVLKDKTIVYIGEIFENLPYPRQNWSEWANDFKDIPEISDTIDRVNEILESRVNVGGLKNTLNPAMTKFNLINNYNWKEKTEVENNVTLKSSVSKEEKEKADQLLNSYLNDNTANPTIKRQ